VSPLSVFFVLQPAFIDTHAHSEFCYGKIGTDATYVAFLKRIGTGVGLHEAQAETRLLRRCRAVVVDWCKPHQVHTINHKCRHACVVQVMGLAPTSPYYAYGIDSTLAGADDLWATTGVRMHYGLGCHPIHAAEWTDALGARIRARFAQPGPFKDGLVCVGEMGLDYQRVEESCVFMCAAICTFF
jgi:Tat protein secretion system quality control protein TatD with DNase activity